MAKRSIDEQQLRAVLMKQLQKVKEWYVLYKNNPYLPKNIHQLRVNLRKLRAQLNFIKPLIEEEIYKNLNGNLREIARQLSPLREADVLIKECNKIAKEHPTLIENYSDVFRFIVKDRLQLTKSVTTKKAYIHQEEKLQETEKNINELDFDLTSVNASNLNSFIEERFIQKYDKFENSLNAIDMEDYENIHEVRKQAKKIRYVTNTFKKWLPKNKQKEISKRTEEVQMDLGDYTDAHVNVQMLNAYKNKITNQSLIDSINVLIKQYN